MYTYINRHIHMHRYIYIHIYIYRCIYTYIYLNIYNCICIYIYIYIYIYIHIYTNIYTYIHLYIHTFIYIIEYYYEKSKINHKIVEFIYCTINIYPNLKQNFSLKSICIYIKLPPLIFILSILSTRPLRLISPITFNLFTFIILI
jgi:hypothetical protein